MIRGINWGGPVPRVRVLRESAREHARALLQVEHDEGARLESRLGA